ncbi:MAG: hypothetical protein ACI4Q5_03985 [Porcipelethomonas sp.]
MKFAIIIMLCIINAFSASTRYGDYSDVNTDFSISEADSEITEESETAEENDFKYTEEYVQQNMPEEYSATYTSYMSGEPETYSLTVTKEGVYMVHHDTESLYVLNENGMYNSFHQESDGRFTPITIEYDAETINAWTVGVMDQFFTRYQAGPQDYTLAGAETVAGTKCEVYIDGMAESPDNLGEYGEAYYIEPNTGICLKYVNGRHEYEFECTEFKTDNISLPEHE